MDSIEHYLKGLEARSIYIIREAYATIEPLGMLWSIGKDSTTLLYLVKKAFFGRVPFPLIHLDTDMEMDEVYAFRDWIAKEWNFDLRIEKCPPEEEMDQTLPPASRAATIFSILEIFEPSPSLVGCGPGLQHCT